MYYFVLELHSISLCVFVSQEKKKKKKPTQFQIRYNNIILSTTKELTKIDMSMTKTKGSQKNIYMFILLL